MDSVRKQLWLDASMPFDGNGVRIAVIDSGVDASHPDLAHAIDFGTSGSTTALASSIEDYCYHGTHIAGIIAGNGAASSGQYRGIAPGAQLQILKAYNGDSGLAADVAAAVERAVESDADIINYSSGYAPEDKGPPPWVWPPAVSIIEEAFEAAAAAGVLCVVAAGNHGPRQGSINRPGGHSDVLTIGAIDGTGNVWEHSSRGPYRVLQSLRPNAQRRWDPLLDIPVEERIKPDIVMPGVSVVSCRASKGKMFTQVQLLHVEDPKCPYLFESGSSDATAVATGVAALLLQAARKEGVPLGDNPGRILKRLLMYGARRLQSGNAYDYGMGTVKWDVLYGTLRDYAGNAAFRLVVQEGAQLRLLP